MAIRSIDMQVMIPKTPEVQKIKIMEMQNAQNNLSINLQKQQQENEQKLKQVKPTDKAYEGKIDRDAQKKNSNQKQQSKKNKEDDQKSKSDSNKKASKIRTKIDIRI